jgi:hypothetical protein
MKLRPLYAVRVPINVIRTLADTPADQLELSTYEYAALEERYRTLVAQHSELRKLSMTYHDIIQGSSSYESTDVGINQLRIEAGREGLRAKALEANTLRPIVRDAGGPQALVIQTQSIQALIEKAGGVQKLKEMVLDAQMLRLRVDQVGGLHGLDDLIVRSNLLRSERREHAELRNQVEGPEGLKDKALKYDMAQQAFAAIERGPAVERTQDGHVNPASTRQQTSNKALQAPRSASLSEVAVMMNPARARLLTASPPLSDPDRDLYEPKLLVSNLSRKTGSNDVPLGRYRDVKFSANQGPVNVLGKRKHEPDSYTSTKRPRVDVGRASALLQATLAASSTSSAPFSSHPGCPQAITNGFTFDNNKERNERPSQNQGTRHGFRQRVEDVQYQVAKLIESRGDVETSSLASPRGGRPSVEDLLESVDRVRQPMVKTEDTSDDPQTSRPIDVPTAPIGDQGQGHGSTKAMVGGYPIALWVGGNSANSCNPTDLIKANDIPSELANFLSTEMKKYMGNSNFKVWNAMPPNSDTCVLRYLVEGHIPSGLPQERRACRLCSSAWYRHHRPCALLQEIDRVRMVVFMPLRDALRRGVAWTETRFWVMYV